MSDLNDCRVYWGSHGCRYARGHEGHHFCCCDCDNHPDPDSGCVGAYPYYGTIVTRFYGDDAPWYDRLSMWLDRRHR